MSMRYPFLGRRAFLGLACCAALGACGAPAAQGQDASTDPPVLGHVSAQELEAWLDQKDFLLVNVHVPYAGQIPGTDVHLTYENVDAIAAYIGSDLDTKVVVYCMSDNMALIAGPALVERGYRAITMLDGGMLGWTAAGYTLE